MRVRIVFIMQEGFFRLVWEFKRGDFYIGPKIKFIHTGKIKALTGDEFAENL